VSVEHDLVHPGAIASRSRRRHQGDAVAALAVIFAHSNIVKEMLMLYLKKDTVPLRRPAHCHLRERDAKLYPKLRK
jgi:hypothetical protein